MSDTPPMSSKPENVPVTPSGSGKSSNPSQLPIYIMGGLALVVIFIIVGLFLAVRPPQNQIQGMVEARVYTVATKVPSRVETMLAEEGQMVTAGQELAVLSSPEVENRDTQAQALLRSSEAFQSMSQEGARPQDIRTAEAVWQAAQASAHLAALTARRSEALYAEGVISTQRRDEAVAARNATASQAEAARQQYLKAVAGSREQEKVMAGANVSGAQAAVSEVESLLRETRLLAPHNGEISERFANLTELVMPGVPVFTIVDIGDPWVNFSVRESEYNTLKIGKEIRGDIPALQMKDVPFKITVINPQGEFATWRSTRQSTGYDIRSFQVRAKPVTPVQGLRPGMSVLFDWPRQ